jgi:hypothetical protein
MTDPADLSARPWAKPGARVSARLVDMILAFVSSLALFRLVSRHRRARRASGWITS